MRAIMKSNRSSLFSSSALGRRISINALNFSMNLINIKYTFEKMKHYFFLPSLIDNEVKARTAKRFSLHKKVFAAKYNNIL